MNLENKIQKFLSANDSETQNLEINDIFKEIMNLIYTKDFKKGIKELKSKRFNSKLELIEEIRKFLKELGLEKYVDDLILRIIKDHLLLNEFLRRFIVNLFYRRTSKYEEIVSTLKTGDIYLSSGIDKYCQTIKFGEDCQFSHTGIVVLSKDIYGEEDPEHPVLLWESTTNDEELPDIIDGKAKKGAMLVDLKDTIKNQFEMKNHSLFAIRRHHGEDEIDIDKFKDFIKKVHSADFPEFSDMIKKFLEGRILDESIDLKQYFCSELSADTFIHLGVLTDLFPVNSYYPKDYSTEGNLGIIKKIWFEDELFIDPETI